MDNVILPEKREIYLDYTATTPTLSQAVAVMADIYARIYGNPSSVHAAGIMAREVIEDARGKVLSLLGVRRAEQGSLFFCGSGTEASNTAIFGAAKAKKWRVQPVIITTDSEHPSVEEPLKRLESEGFTVEHIPTSGGALDISALEKALNAHENVILASFMLVNNETGALYDIASAFSLVKRLCPAALTHCDAVQGFGKLPFTPETLGADMVTVSAHKLGGPKGIGALYVTKPVLTAKKLVPYILGGGQENGFRSGTENVAAVAGFGAAADYNLKNGVRARFRAETAELRRTLSENLPAGAVLNTPRKDLMPHIASITLPGIRSEVMLRYLSERGIYVSSGSACSSRHRGISHTLLAFGLNSEEADRTIRVSFSDITSEEDIIAFITALSDGINRLAKI